MKNKGSLWAGVLALLLAAPAAAVTQSQLINFQGKLLSPSTNLPQTAPVTLVFNIYDDPTLTTAPHLLWGPETQASIPLTNGVFSAQIGSVLTLPRSVFVGGLAYLSVTVQGDAGGEMLPRARLVMSPSAYTATQLSDAGSVYLIADAVYSTFTNAGNLFLPGGVSASSAAFTSGVNATSATFTQFVTASSGIFTASGSSAFGLTVSSGVQIQNGVLDMNGAQGITNSYGLQTGTLTVTGANMSVGGSSFTVTGGSATIAYGLTAASATFTAMSSASEGLTVSSGIAMQAGNLDMTGGIDLTGSAVVSGTMTAGQFMGIGVSTTAIKLSAQTISANTVLAADPYLSLPIPANTTWVIDGLLEAWTGSATPGFKNAFVLTSATTMRVDMMGNANTATTLRQIVASSSAYVAQWPLGANIVNPIFFKGYIVNGASAGTLQVQWAQNVSNAALVQLSSGSYINATRVK